MRRLAALALVAAVACGTTSQPAPDAVTGLIISIGRADDGTIESFEVRHQGTSHRIHIDPARDYGFDLEHLAEHRAGRLPVRVTLAERDGVLYATEIQDA